MANGQKDSVPMCEQHKIKSVRGRSSNRRDDFPRQILVESFFRLGRNVSVWIDSTPPAVKVQSLSNVRTSNWRNGRKWPRSMSLHERKLIFNSFDPRTAKTVFKLAVDTSRKVTSSRNCSQNNKKVTR